MAMEQHTASRRGMLALLAAAPIAALPIAAGAATGEWDKALAAYRSAVAAQEAFYRGPYTAAAIQYDAVRNSMGPLTQWLNDEQRATLNATRFPEIEARHTRLCDAESNAMAALFATPAPTVAALALKLEIAIKEEFWNLDAEEISATMLADARRLGGH